MLLDFSKIQIAMAAKCMKQAELAELMGIKLNTLKTIFYRIRRGMRCKPYTAGRLSQFLDIPLSGLVKEKPSERG